MTFDARAGKHRCDKCGTLCDRTPSGWLCPDNATCGARLRPMPYARDADEPEDDKPCPECDGTGEVECDECWGDGVVECDLGHEHTCPECGGAKKVPCPKCCDEEDDE